eukprot:307360_1
MLPITLWILLIGNLLCIPTQYLCCVVQMIYRQLTCFQNTEKLSLPMSLFQTNVGTRGAKSNVFDMSNYRTRFTLTNEFSTKHGIAPGKNEIMDIMELIHIALDKTYGHDMQFFEKAIKIEENPKNSWMAKVKCSDFVSKNDEFIYWRKEMYRKWCSYSNRDAWSHEDCVSINFYNRIEKTYRLHPNDALIAALRGRAAIYENNYIKAEQSFKRVIKLGSNKGHSATYVLKAQSELKRIQKYKQSGCEGEIADYMDCIIL